MPLFEHTPSIPPTGNLLDDLLLAQIAKRSSLEKPRHWVQYLYVADEEAVRSAAELVEGAGWQLQKVDIAADGGGWVVIAERHDAVTSPEAVIEARQVFERIAASVPGGDYDGWEASL
jgi:hypothetical protein